MPNVMGREFPYTPEGMAAAQQYRQALGMRDAGPMGFRPVRMRHGGVPAFAAPPMAPDVRAIFQGLVDVTRSGSPDDVRRYIDDNRRDLNDLASMLPPGQAAFVQSTLDSFAPPLMPSQPMQPMQGADQVPPEQGGNLGRISDTELTGVGRRFAPFIDDIEAPRNLGLGPLVATGMGAGAAESSVGLGPYPPELEPEEQTPIPGPMNRGGLMSLRRR